MMGRSSLLAAVLGLCSAASLAASALLAPALAQNPGGGTVTVVREVDSNNYDPHKSTARGASEVLFMMADTLVSLDYDMATISPGLAVSWSVSPDAKTYTFRLRDDVTFCDGRKMTADDVVYSIKRWIDPATRSPVKWRAGPVDDVVATDPLTVEYRLKAPFSEMLYQLTQSFAVIVDKNNVEALGNDFGVKGFNGTGPFCWADWKPRNEMRLKRHAGYKWGPPIDENRGPAGVEEIVWKIAPEDSTRLAAVLSGQSQVTQYLPYSGMAAIRGNRNLKLVSSDEAFWTYFIGFKIDHEGVDELPVRKALVMAVDQPAIAKNLFFGEVEPADSYISRNALDWNKAVDAELLHTNVPEANRLLDEAGWTKGADGFRSKNGKKLSPLLYTFSGSTWQKLAEAVQGDMRKVGVDLRVQYFDATAAWGKLATQEFDAFGMSYPYISAGDALNLYFRSANIPTPNRMNYREARVDQLLDQGMTATNDADRASAYGEVLADVHRQALWIPLYHEPMKIAVSSRLAPIRAHNIYGCGLYKGLTLRYVK